MEKRSIYFVPLLLNAEGEVYKMFSAKSADKITNQRNRKPGDRYLFTITCHIRNQIAQQKRNKQFIRFFVKKSKPKHNHQT